MKFIIGEGGWSMLERASYHGGIGLFFDNTLGGICAYTIFAIFCILAVIGLITVTSWLIRGIKPRETDGEYWRRTGRMRK